MPTNKPRITLTLEPAVYETFTRLAELQGRTRPSVIVELLETVHEPLMRTVALLEAAQNAPKEVRDGLKNTIEELELDLVGSVGSTFSQMDWLTRKMGESNPRSSNTGVRYDQVVENKGNSKNQEEG